MLLDACFFSDDFQVLVGVSCVGGNGIEETGAFGIINVIFQERENVVGGLGIRSLIFLDVIQCLVRQLYRNLLFGLLRGDGDVRTVEILPFQLQHI